MKKSKKKKNNYFPEETKKAVVEFIKAETIDEKNYIYEQKLYKPLDEMIKININTHGFFQTGFEVQSLVQQVHMFVIEQLRAMDFIEGEGFTKFDPDEGDAFSYCNRMIKNYMVQLQQQNQRRQQKLGMESIDEDENYYIETYYEEDPHFKLDEYFVEYIEYMGENIDIYFEKEDEKKIAHVFMEIIKDPRNNFSNKKTLMIYFKNIMNEKNYKLNKVLNTFKDMYYELIDEYSEKLELEEIYD
jgi:hypothetical protein